MSSLQQKKKYLLPEHDEQRMKVLFSPLREKSVNAVNYETTVKFWKRSIIEFCQHKGDAEITLNELRIAFNRKGNVPRCLETVMAEMIQVGDLRTRTQFNENPQSSSWTAWTLGLLKRPILWSVGKVKDRIISQDSNELPYIVIEVVMEQADMLLVKFQNQVISLKELKSKISNLEISETGLSLVLHELLCREKLTVFKFTDSQDRDEKILLKFSTTTHKVNRLTEVEISIHNLEATERELFDLIGEIEIKIQAQENLAKQLLTENKKILAKNALRKRNILAKNCEKRTQCLENVQSILSKIHEIASDAKILDAYRAGTKSLVLALQNSGITLESVENAIHDMQDAIELHDDIQSSLSSPTKAPNDDEDADLEKELSSLVNEQSTTESTNLDDDLLKQLEQLSVVNDPLPEDEKSRSPSKSEIPAAASIALAEPS